MTELRIIAHCALMLAGAVACVDVGAQASATAPSASSANAADRAQKEADRPLYWIRVLAEKPAAKPAAPAKAVVAEKPVARPAPVVAEARPAERVKVAAVSPETSATTNSSVVTPVPTAPAPVAAAVVAAPPAAIAPSVPMPTGTAAPTASGGLDAGVSAPTVAGALAAPALTAPVPVDVPAAPEVEEPDPGLIMTKSADPQFPMATMRRLRKGEVEVRFEVGADGQVDVVSVVRTTNPSLNSAALDAVRQWQFKPTPKGHTAVVDLAFDLDA